MVNLKQIIQRFLAGYDSNGGNYNDRDVHYENAILWAQEQIQEMDDVEEVFITESNYPFLISRRSKLAVFKSVVRQKSLTILITAFCFHD